VIGETSASKRTRPEPHGRGVVAPVEQRIEGLKHQGLFVKTCADFFM
jgi:hypothetical protein